jgi:short-subunit dehydrogenase
VSELRGKNVLLTGSSRGIGPVIAHALAREGANLALTARSADELGSVAADLAAEGVRVTVVPADLGDSEAIAPLIERVRRELGEVDVLVNNAGMRQTAEFASLDPSAMQEVMQTNVMAPMLLTRLLLPGMIERGSGHIVNIASVAGKVGVPFEAAYSASKAALVEWSAALRVELEGSGVGVSCICPGYVRATEATPSPRRRRAPRLIGSVPPARVAQAVVSAIRDNRREVLVMPLPVRPLLALAELSPWLRDRALGALGVKRRNRDVAASDHR